MNRILSLWNRTGEPVEEMVAKRLLDANRDPGGDGVDAWLHKDVILAGWYQWITPEEQDQSQPRVDEKSGCVLACSTRLDNRQDLMAALGLVPGDGSSLSDSDLILKAYMQWGIDCVEHLLGDFAFVLWDPNKRQLYAARDALGGRELVYYLDDKVALLASRISMILQHPAVKPQLNEKKIAEFLAVMWDDNQGTFYKGIFHLQPAHCMLVTADSLRVWQYWEPDLRKTIGYKEPGQYAEHYRELIMESVRSRLRGIHPVGISLSGGLDSSSLACLAGEVLAETDSRKAAMHSYSYVFDKFKECDERAYINPVIEQASRVFPIHPTMVNGDDLWPRPLADDWLVQRDYPQQDAYHYLLKAILQAARQDGVQTMLSGFYGDDLYAGEEFWFADLLLSGHICRAVPWILENAGTLKWKGDILDHGLRAAAPGWLKHLYRRINPSRPEWDTWIHPAWAGGTGLRDHVPVEQVRPHRKLPGRWDRFISLFFSGYPASFTAWQDAAAVLGMEYSFPFADRRIVEFMLALPTELFSLPGTSRRILRQAMENSLPEGIRQRQTKADFLALYKHGVYGVGWESIRKMLKSSQILGRGFIRKEWLDEELGSDKKTRGGLILWLVISLETWFQKYWN